MAHHPSALDPSEECTSTGEVTLFVDARENENVVNVENVVNEREHYNEFQRFTLLN